MDDKLAQEIGSLEIMTVPQLRRRYWEVFGEESNSKSKPYLRKRIAWGIQANKHGGLSPGALEKIQEHADVRLLHIRLPEGAFERIAAAVGVPKPVEKRAASTKLLGGLEPGTILRRTFKGTRYEVEVLATGFRYDAQTYRSLSAVARAITGTNWNGRLFFGLGKEGTEA